MENRYNDLSSPNFNLLSVEDRLRFSFNIELAKCVIEKRKELGWSQAQLAEKSGVNRITITKLENFQHTVSVEVMLKLLYTLGMRIKFVDIQ